MSKEKIIAYIIIFFMACVGYIFNNIGSDGVFILITGFIFFIFCFIIYKITKVMLEKQCKKCNSFKTKLINTISNFDGWLYMNKKGEPDKRRKNNKEIHCKTKEYKCMKCENEFEVKNFFLK